jgi:hypothetical protein
MNLTADHIVALREIAIAVNDNSRAHGFWADSDVSHLSVNQNNAIKAEKIALMHSELSEALETIRKPGAEDDKHCPEFMAETVEFADCIIRILDYCGEYDLDIGGALFAKHKYNCNRPFKHGKEF